MTSVRNHDVEGLTDHSNSVIPDTEPVCFTENKNILLLPHDNHEDLNEKVGVLNFTNRDVGKNTETQRVLQNEVDKDDTNFKHYSEMQDGLSLQQSPRSVAMSSRHTEKSNHSQPSPFLAAGSNDGVILSSCNGEFEDVTFDFEEAITREEEERVRLLESQGLIMRRTGSDQTVSEGSQLSTSRGGAATSNAGDVISLGARSRATVCRHWIRGMCWKGDFCEFLHQYDTGKMPLCRQFMKTGQCADRNRGTCMFLHPRVEDAPICLHYYLGFCRSGPRCRKRHQRLPVDELPPLVPDWYLHLILENARSVVPAECDPDTETVIEGVEKKCRQLAALSSASSSISPKNVASNQSESQSNVNKENNAQENSSKSNQFLTLSLLESSNSSSLATESAQQHQHARKKVCSSASHQSSAKKATCLVDETVLELARTTGIPQLPSSSESSIRTRVFMIKSNDLANIYKSVRLGVWATGKQNTRILERAFADTDHIILLFSANESGGFQGYAKMVTSPSPSLHPNLWGSFSARLGSNFRVQWLKQARIEFEQLGWLTNPLNDNQPIRKSRDCQEVPFSVASIICTVLHRQPDEDLLKGTTEENKPRIDHAFFFELPSEAERRQRELELGILSSVESDTGKTSPPSAALFSPADATLVSITPSSSADKVDPTLNSLRPPLPSSSIPSSFPYEIKNQQAEQLQPSVTAAHRHLPFLSAQQNHCFRQRYFLGDIQPPPPPPPFHADSSTCSTHLSHALAPGGMTLHSFPSSARIALQQRQQQLQQHMQHQSIKAQPYPSVLPAISQPVLNLAPASYAALRSLPQALRQLHDNRMIARQQHQRQTAASSVSGNNNSAVTHNVNEFPRKMV